MKGGKLLALLMLCLGQTLGIYAQEVPALKTPSVLSPADTAAEPAVAVNSWQLLPLPEKQLPPFLLKHPEYHAVQRTAWNAWFKQTVGHETAPAESAAAGPHLTSLEWQADFDGRVMRGELALQIAAGKQPQLLVLEPWPFSISKASWRDSPESVVIGNDERGVTKVLVTRPGTLVLAVELSGKTEGDDVVFQWTGPLPLARRLNLTVGTEWVVNSEDGVFVERTSAGENKERSVWQAAGPRPLTIRFTPHSARANTLLVLRPSATYELGTRGLDLLWEGRWEQFGQTPEKLVLQVDPALQVQDITWGEQPLPFKLGTPLPNGALPLEIALPQRLPTASPTLRIQASAPIITDQLASLPQIRAPDAILQNGSWQILALSPYRISQIETRDCQITQSEKLAGPLQGEALKLQTTGKNPDLQLLTRWQKPRGTWRSALTISNQDREPRGVWCGELILDEGHLNLIQFSVDSSWIIESVESEPAALVRSWQRMERVTGRTLYRLYLQHDLHPREALRLTFRARRPNQASVVRIEPGQFDLVVPLELERERSYVSIVQSDEYETEFLGTGEPRRLDPRDLPSRDLALLTTPARGKLYRWPGAAPGWGLRLLSRPARARANLETKLALTNEGAVESYRIQFQTGLPPTGKLTLNFSRAQGELVQWSQASTGEPLLAKRNTIETDPQAQGQAPGEQWELALPEKIGEELVIVGQRKLGFANEYQPALLTLANNQDQPGTLRFFSSAENAPTVELGNLPLVPVPDEIESNTGELARWTYAATASDAEQTRGPTLKRGMGQTSLARMIIWSANLETLIQPQNSANHQLTLLLENTGYDRWSFELPTGATDVAVFLNERLIHPRTNPARQQLQIELDPRQRYVQLRLYWRSNSKQQAWKITAIPEWPSFNEKPLSRRWVIWTTNDYTPLHNSAVQTPVQLAAQAWTGPGFADSRHRWWVTSQFAPQNPDDSPTNAAALDEWWKRWHGQTRLPGTWREQCSQHWNAALGLNSTERGIANRSEAERDELSVDARAWAMLGIVADELIQPEQLETFLHEAVLLAGPRGWLLTTRAGLLDWTGLEALVESKRAYHLTEHARYNAQGITLPSREASWAAVAVPLSRWGLAPNLGTLPWPWTGGSPADLGANWIPYLAQLELLDEPIQFLERRQALTLAVALFVILLGTAVWWVGCAAPTKILSGGILLACAGMLPQAIQIIGTSALAGLTAGQALRWLGWWPWAGWYRATDSRSKNRVSKGTIAALATSILLLVIMASAGFSRWSWSAESRTALAPAKVIDTALRTAYSPVDEQGLPVGDVVYVPPALAATITAHERKPDSTYVQTSWLLRSAKYVGQVIRPLDDRPRSGNWQAVLQIETLAAAQWVRLPYSAFELVILPDGIQVDGQSGEWRWTENRTELEVFFSTAGSHRIELKFLPLTADRMSSEIGFSIPRSPSNEFELTAPANLPLEYALPGSWNWQADKQLLTGSCGELAHFKVGWPKYDELPKGSTQTEIEIAQWLRVQPALTTLDVRIPIRMLNGRLTELDLVVDERLRLLRLRGDAGVAWKAEQKGRSLKLNFVRPLQDRGTVELTFLLDTTANPGSFALPRCEILGQTVKSQWLFGSVDPTLQYQELGINPGMLPVDQAVVQRVWGGDPGRPLFAYQLLRPNLPWKLVIQPRSAVVTSTTSVAWLNAAHEQLDWGCQTRIEVSNGSLLIVRGKLAADWLPDRVIVRQQQQELPQRWSIGNEREISIFLESPLDGEASILLLGKRTMPLQANVPWNWPQWHGHLASSAHLLFERDAETLFRLPTRPIWTDVPRAEWSKQFASWPKEYRQANKLAAVEFLPQALWAGKPSPQPIPLRTVANQPQGKLDLSVELIQREQNWYALVHLNGSLTAGQLDRLELALPPTCRDLKIADQLTTASIEQGAAGERVLVFRPVVPLQGEWNLSWEHRLEFEPGQPVSWPQLRPLTKLRCKQFAILPSSDESRVPAWRIKGLNPIEFDQAHAELAQGRDTQLYELVASPHWAEYLPQRAGDTSPEVVLASHSLARQNTALVSGVSTWDLLPEGASRVLLALPPGCELLQGRVDGLNIAWRKLSSVELQARLAERAAEMILASNNPTPATMYEVTLVNQFLPQRLTAVYHQELAANPDSNNVPLPELWNLVVRRSRLQFWQPTVATATVPESTARREWNESLARGYLELGTFLQPALQTNNNAVAQSWQQLWERRFRLQTQLLLADQTDAAPVAPEVETQQNQLLTDLRKLCGRSLELTSLHLSAVDVWRAFGISQTVANYAIGHGSQLAASLTSPLLPAHDWRWLTMLLAAGLFAATSIALLAARTGWGNLPGRYPTTSLLLASLLWLIFLQPCEFALLLAVLAVLTWAVKRRSARKLVDPTDFELAPTK